MKKLAKMMAVAIASVVLSTGSLSAVEIKKIHFHKKRFSQKYPTSSLKIMALRAVL